jgi:hypothetical protein
MNVLCVPVQTENSVAKGAIDILRFFWGSLEIGDGACVASCDAKTNLDVMFGCP